MAEDSIKDLKKSLYLALHKTLEMLELTEEGFTKNRLASLDQADALAIEIQAREDTLTAALAKLASANSDARALLAVPSQVEKIATSIKRISENSRGRIKDGLLFSDKAMNEMGRLFEKSREALKKTGEVAVTGSSAGIDSSLAVSDDLERMAKDFATSHEERLVTGECSPKSSSIYLCMLYAFEDMGAAIKDAVNKLSGK